jgi:hypothetical protein
MKKFALAFCALLISSAAFSAQVKLTLSGVVTKTDRDFLASALGEEFADEVVAVVKSGREISVSFDHRPELDPRDPPECEVKIKEKSNGGGSASVDVGSKRVGNVDIRGSGGVDREITVKGPCKEVRDIIRDITGHGGGKDK